MLDNVYEQVEFRFIEPLGIPEGGCGEKVKDGIV
jgi:hypothetical protein